MLPEAIRLSCLESTLPRFLQSAEYLSGGSLYKALDDAVLANQANDMKPSHFTKSRVILIPFTGTKYAYLQKTVLGFGVYMHAKPQGFISSANVSTLNFRHIALCSTSMQCNE